VRINNKINRNNADKNPEIDQKQTDLEILNLSKLLNRQENGILFGSKAVYNYAQPLGLKKLIFKIYQIQFLHRSGKSCVKPPQIFSIHHLVG